MATEDGSDEVISTTTEASKLLADVGARVKQADVYDRIVEVLTEREVQARVDLLDSALKKRAEAQKELRKLERPDQVAYDADGKVTAESFSKARADEVKKAREQAQKLEGAITTALLRSDFSKLKELK
jgi:hypothetical protein